ncbi:MAG TPA: FtsX-like permease family protein [Symbiobacteriaceae bacterium]
MKRGGWPDSFLLLVWFNLLRRPGRTVAVALAVALAAGILHAGALTGLGVRRALAIGTARLGADLLVVPEGAAEATHTALVVGEPMAFYMDGSVVDRIAALPGVQAASPQVFVETMASSACCTGRLFLVGFDPETDFTVQPWLMKELGRPLGPRDVLVGNHILGLTGDPLRFYGTEFRIAARLDPTGMGMDETVFLPLEAVAEMTRASATLAEKPLAIPEGHISAVLVKLAEPERAAEMARLITERIPGVAVLTGGDVTRAVIRSLTGLMALLVPTALGLAALAGVLLALLFSTVSAERCREIGLLRAIGASARQTALVLLGEAAVLGAAGGLAGVAAGFGIFGLFQRAIRFSYTLPFLWPSPAVQAGVAIAVCALAAGLAVLAAAVPVRRILRLEPHHAIHGGRA